MQSIIPCHPAVPQHLCCRLITPRTSINRRETAVSFPVGSRRLVRAVFVCELVQGERCPPQNRWWPLSPHMMWKRTTKIAGRFYDALPRANLAATPYKDFDRCRPWGGGGAPRTIPGSDQDPEASAMVADLAVVTGPTRTQYPSAQSFPTFTAAFDDRSFNWVLA